MIGFLSPLSYASSPAVGWSITPAGFISVEPSEQEMRDYLIVDAEPEFSCTSVPLHYIDLTADLHLIQALKESSPTSYDLRILKGEELERLLRIFDDLPMFVLKANSVIVMFAPAKGATDLDILKGIYTLKKTLAAEFSLVFIESSAPCPGSVIINNL
jgi:hypothetical protein